MFSLLYLLTSQKIMCNNIFIGRKLRLITCLFRFEVETAKFHYGAHTERNLMHESEES